MLTVLALLAVFALVRTVYAAFQSLRSLPRSNADWVYY
jgi:hypothetical protein